MRQKDLVPRFIEALDRRLEEMTFEAGADSPLRVQRQGEIHDFLGEVEVRMSTPCYWKGEEPDHDLETLFELLEEVSPEGYTFGSHVGDGCDFGFWPVEDYE